MEENQQPLPKNVVVVDLTLDDNDDRPPKKRASAAALRENSTKKVCQPSSTTTTTTHSSSTLRLDGDDDDDNDEIEILEGDAIPGNFTVAAGAVNSAALSKTHGDDADFEVVGTKNQTRLPHARQYCTENPFQSVAPSITPAARQAINEKHCNLCYCYVCDVPVSACKDNWAKSHCMANDFGPYKHIWEQARSEMRRQGVAPLESSARIQRANAAAAAATTASRRRNNNAAALRIRPPDPHRRLHGQRRASGAGPWAPNDHDVKRDLSLTQCRHCGWYTRFRHLNFQETEETRSALPGCSDWCEACGRVASKRDLGRKQGAPYTADTDDVDLGVRELPFTVHISDVRQMLRYKERWNQSKWVYREDRQEKEFVRHRLGKHPDLYVLLASIPILSREKLPTDGNVDDTTDLPVSANETQCIVLDNPRDLQFLVTLYQSDPLFGTVPKSQRDRLSSWLRGDLCCSWDRNLRKGTIRVRVCLRQICSSAQYKYGASPSAMAAFLATWFNVGPFKLADLVNLRASVPTHQPWDPQRKTIPVTTVTLSPQAAETAWNNAQQQEALLVGLYNEEIDENRRTSFSLTSGTGSSVLGGICTNETDFDGTMRRFYREIAFECATEFNIGPVAWHSEATGIVSNHRSMETSFAGKITKNWVAIATCPRATSYSLGTCFSKEDQAMLYRTDNEARELQNQTNSLKGLLDLVENRGHAEAPFVEGLTVELLPFQKQALQWALERETSPGGIQSYLRTKLPRMANPNQDCYYNPILGKFSDSKPSLVRGGIIASQMGLGKTVMTLALILANPAPLEPAAGSNATEIVAQSTLYPENPFRDPDLFERESGANQKRGSIVSRGTLVVCPVSLVAQWIDEANSKLSEPGLVYMYHGQNRIRDPRVLAQKAIIVTTYDTLRSDASSHYSKQSPTYCSPCEMVRFWRIVCDESHTVRNKAGGIMNLVADNRWMVSGTPINTKVSDLQNQLQFLRLENVTELMTLFKSSFYRHVRDPEVGTYAHDAYNPGLGMFSFFMRSIMIRHSQSQKYTGTDTTLMSLPPVTEHVIAVKFSEQEKLEYSTMEAAALTTYVNLKGNDGRIGKHHLYLMSALTPLRIACAGGKVHVSKENGEQDTNTCEASDSENKSNEKEPKFSNFAFTSKLEALISELEDIRGRDETAKCIVFSQFTTTLNWLKEELPRRGFQFRTLSGSMSLKQRAAALRDFQNDPPTTLFLLSMRAGAVGINLTQASYCFILEPCFNVALEKQACGRVYRLGQKRNVHIFRLVVEESIESRIRQMLQNKYGTSGTTSEQKNHDEDNDNNSNDGDRKPAALVTPAETSLAGSIATDKATVLEEEYDLLFGLQSGAIPPSANTASAVANADDI